MKRRKRTNSHIPARGRLREMADSLWSLAVRNDWNHQCAVCGYNKCESHHLVPRQHTTTRYDLTNGIALCASHHQFDKDLSPHQNAAGWLQWLADHHRDRFNWCVDNRHPRPFIGIKNAAYYCAIIRSLQQYVEPFDFVRIVGQKFAAWLEETNEGE